MLNILPLVGLTAFEKPRPKAGEKSLLHLTGRGIQATGYESPQGFVVQENSTAVMETLPSIQAYQLALRKQLTEATLPSLAGVPHVCQNVRTKSVIVLVTAGRR